MPQRTSRPSSTYRSTSTRSECANASSNAPSYSAGLRTSVTPSELSASTGLTTTGGVGSLRSPARRTTPAGTSTPAAATTARALALSAPSAMTSGGLPTYGMPSASNNAR